nr:hypothetical protein [uncultured Flavobacterium sp.]
MTDKVSDDLAHIRSMMERSSRFISLSGLSGIGAGATGIVGAFFAHKIIEKSTGTINGYYNDKTVYELIFVALVTLIVALFFGTFFTVRKSKKLGLSIWTSTTKKTLIQLSIPLVVGGVFCLALIKYEFFGLIAGTTLIFYGLALLNAEKYVFSDIKYLGLLEIFLGCISLFWIGKGLLFWTIGFGFLHIIYGIILYRKYK